MIPPFVKDQFTRTVRAAGMNETVALIEAKHRLTGEIHYLLVGVQAEDGGEIGLHPFARFLSGNEGIDLYDPPDPHDDTGTKFGGMETRSGHAAS